MRANIADSIVFSLNVNYTNILTVNLDLFHMRGLNILCISNLDKIFTHGFSLIRKADAIWLSILVFELRVCFEQYHSYSEKGEFIL